MAETYIDRQRDQFLSQDRILIVAVLGKTIIDVKVLPLDIPEFL
jgi:hypothetical protein